MNQSVLIQFLCTFVTLEAGLRLLFTKVSVHAFQAYTVHSGALYTDFTE
jgi:hypothetical protein